MQPTPTLVPVMPPRSTWRTRSLALGQNRHCMPVPRRCAASSGLWPWSRAAVPDVIGYAAA